MFNTKKNENALKKSGSKDTEDKIINKNPSIIDLRTNKNSEQEKANMRSEGGQN